MLGFLRRFIYICLIAGIIVGFTLSMNIASFNVNSLCSSQANEDKVDVNVSPAVSAFFNIVNSGEGLYRLYICGSQFQIDMSGISGLIDQIKTELKL
jgi:hypothetical protein